MPFADWSVPEEDEVHAEPMASELATQKAYDPITAKLIADTPSPDEVVRAITSTPVINPLAIMRGQQMGPEMLPSVILRAQRASSVKERAQLMALLQDQETHELRKATLQTQQARLAFDMMKQGASQGNAGIGAAYKAFIDIGKDMDPDRANQWLDTMLSTDVQGGVPQDEASGREFALRALVKAGGLKPKQKERTAPSGFEYTDTGQLQAVPGGPEDPRIIRQQALARQVSSGGGGGGGGGGGFFAPGMTTQTTQYVDPSTGALITESTPYGVMRPKSGSPYAVPLPGVPETQKVKPAQIPEKLRTDYVQTAGILQSARQSFETLKRFAPSFLERTATQIAGAPITPEAGAADSARQALLFSIAKLAEQGALQQPDREVAEGMIGRIFDFRVGPETRRATMGEFERWLQSRERGNEMRTQSMPPITAPIMPQALQSPVMQPAAPPPAPTPNLAPQANSPVPSAPGSATIRKFNPMTGRVE